MKTEVVNGNTEGERHNINSLADLFKGGTLEKDKQLEMEEERISVWIEVEEAVGGNNKLYTETSLSM